MVIAAFALIYVMPLVASGDAALHPRTAWRQANVPRWPFLVLPLLVALGIAVEGPSRLISLGLADAVAAVYFLTVRALVDVAAGMAGKTVGLAGIQSGAYGQYLPAIVGVPVVAWVTLLLVVNASALAPKVAAVAAGAVAGLGIVVSCAVWGNRTD